MARTAGVPAMTATERRNKRIAAHQERLASGNGKAVAPDSLFEKASQNVARNGREIARSVNAWNVGEVEADDLMLRLRVSFPALESSLRDLANAHKLLSGK